MKLVAAPAFTKEQVIIKSNFLNREVIVDIYQVDNNQVDEKKLLFINDGQDLEKMSFQSILNELFVAQAIQPLVCIAIHAGFERKMEYGTSKVLDFMGRGAKAAAHHQFVLQELIPLLKTEYRLSSISEMSYAGFSLGGLSAIDMVWNHPGSFRVAGVFSGSLWWRSRDLNDDYDEERDRIMHQEIRKGKYYAGLKFYFTTGSMDETADRNNNGIIDSIDDTLGLIEELKKKGYTDKEIKYINYEDGKHDIDTWARAFPGFLKWGWGKEKIENGNNFESC